MAPGVRSEVRTPLAVAGLGGECERADGARARAPAQTDSSGDLSSLTVPRINILESDGGVGLADFFVRDRVSEGSFSVDSPRSD